MPMEPQAQAMQEASMGRVDKISIETTLRVFYQVERAGQFRLSDGGGPFGFDVTVAVLVDDLIRLYGCDAVCETGCFVGDTTVYLAHRYPGLPVYTCDIDPVNVRVTARRLAGCANVTARTMDSPGLVAEVIRRFKRPLFFLDAHWGPGWPLRAELTAIGTGNAVVLIHDFDVGHPRFSFDSYCGVPCGPALLAGLEPAVTEYFAPDPRAAQPLPCLQVGRRAGVAVVVFGMDAK
ncbi:hypothetical protein, partial [Actinomadura sp. SCN-SB]|uniref:hypothetical protein n=1 Tax=Actinomadura sp. SCN-SB TaxID=3373092 RepID=UPI0037503C33